MKLNDDIEKILTERFGGSIGRMVYREGNGR